MQLGNFRQNQDATDIARSIGAVNIPPAISIAPDRLPLLITGASGVTGFNAFYYFANRYPGQVFGQRPVETFRFNDDGILPFNLEDQETIRRVIDEYGIRSILSCGGNCALKSCELDPVMAQNVNVGGVQSIVNALNRSSTQADIRLVHLSVDMVFSGTRGGNHVETDETDPVTVYGKTMVEGESIVTNQIPDACILRVSLPMGVSFNGHAGAIDWIQSRFAASRPATLYYDEVRTPTFVQCLNALFEFMLNDNACGIFHCGSSSSMSLFEIAQVINRVGGYDPKLLRGCFRIEAGPIPPRAGNVTMNSDKLLLYLDSNEDWIFSSEETLRKWPYVDSQKPLDRNWHFERDNLTRQIGAGSFEALVKNLYQYPDLSRIDR